MEKDQTKNDDTERGRSSKEGTRVLENLTEKDKKLYWACVGLIQEIAQNGDLEEACELLEEQLKKGGS